MALLTLRELDKTTAGVTLPKGDLKLEGIVDEDGEIIEKPQLNVRRPEPGKWVVERVDDERIPSSPAAD